MATNNPVGAIRDVSSNPSLGQGIHQIVGRITGGGTHAITIETKCKTVLSAIVVNETDHVLLTPTIASSTTNSGTQKVTFTVANTKTYSYIITAQLYKTITTDTTSADATITYNPVSGN